MIWIDTAYQILIQCVDDYDISEKVCEAERTRAYQDTHVKYPEALPPRISIRLELSKYQTYHSDAIRSLFEAVSFGYRIKTMYD